MAIITFNEIIEVNGILEQKHLNFKLHLRDVNHRIMELNMPERIIIAVIQRNHRVLVPKGDMVVLYTQTYMANADDLEI